MIKVNLILLFLIFNSNLFGQYFNRYGNTADTNKILAINNYRFKVDSLSLNGDSINLILDSIEVRGKISNNKIETISFFKSSKSVLNISFYLKDCNLVAAAVRQPSPRFNDLNAYSTFYFENDSVFYSDYYFSVRMCLAIPFKTSFTDVYGYNPNLLGDSLKRYVNQLFLRFKTAANRSIGKSGLDVVTSSSCNARQGLWSDRSLL